MSKEPLAKPQLGTFDNMGCTCFCAGYDEDCPRHGKSVKAKKGKPDESGRGTVISAAGVSLSVERYNQLIASETSLRNALNVVEVMAFCDSPDCIARKAEITANGGSHIHKPKTIEVIKRVYYGTPTDMVKYLEELAESIKREAVRETVKRACEIADKMAKGYGIGAAIRSAFEKWE